MGFGPVVLCADQHHYAEQQNLLPDTVGHSAAGKAWRFSDGEALPLGGIAHEARDQGGRRLRHSEG